MQLANGHARAVLADHHDAIGFYIRRARAFYGYDWGAYDAAIKLIREYIYDARRYRLRRGEGMTFEAARQNAAAFTGHDIG